MTRDDVIRMAREAGFGPITASTWDVFLENFAALVAAAEREAAVADAERYRWLRDRAWPFEFKGNKPEDADAAIDAEIKKHGP